MARFAALVVSVLDRCGLLGDRSDRLDLLDRGRSSAREIGAGVIRVGDSPRVVLLYVLGRIEATRDLIRAGRYREADGRLADAERTLKQALRRYHESRRDQNGSAA